MTWSAVTTMLVVVTSACGNGGGIAKPEIDAAPIAIDAPPAPVRPDATPQVFAELHVTWSLVDRAGSAQPCPAAYPTAVLIAQQADAAPIYDQFDCSAGSGTATYEVGTYAFQLDIANHLGADLYMASLPTTIELAASGSASFTLVTDGGYDQLAWVLVDAAGNGTTCAAAGVDDIDVTLTAGSDAPIVQTYPCAAGSATSAVIPGNEYDITVGAATASGAAIGTPTDLGTQNVAELDAVTALGVVQIAVSPP